MLTKVCSTFLVECVSDLASACLQMRSSTEVWLGMLTGCSMSTLPLQPSQRTALHDRLLLRPSRAFLTTWPHSWPYETYKPR